MNADSFPTFRAWGRLLRRCLRRIRLIFFSRKSLVVYLVILSLGTLVWFADRWHGRHTWAAEKERLAAAGESLDLKTLLPGRPPDAGNFCAIPELKALRLDRTEPESELSRDRVFMWYGKDTVGQHTKQGRAYRMKVQLPYANADSSLAETCRAFRKTGALPQQPLSANPAEELVKSAAEWEDLLAALDAATTRPFAILLPAPAERADRRQQPAFSRIFRLVRSLTLHGLASLEVHNMAGAHRDLHILERLADAIQNERELFGVLVAEAVRRNGDQVIRSGIRRHQWTEAELAQFIKARSEEDLTVAWSTGLQVYRTGLCKTLEHPAGNELQFIASADKDVPWSTNLRTGVQGLYYKLAPEGTGLRYCAAISRFYSHLASEVRTPATNESWLTRMRRMDVEGYPAVFGSRFTEDTPRMHGSPLFNRRLLRGACLLEEYYLQNKKYPASLDAVFAGAPETFTDVDGNPLQYRTNAEGSNFRLWSVGWDGQDDLTKPKPKERPDDWVFSTES